MCADARTLAEPAALTVDVVTGAMAGTGRRYEKRLADLAGAYRDEGAYRRRLARDDGSPVYWVDTSTVEHGDGALSVGLSVLRPGRVGREFAMTRGHLHEHAEAAELYFGIAGQGVLLMDSLDGRSRALPLSAGRAVHVPGGWVHRSVNTGSEPLQTLFCYPADAGQDYGIIERAGGMAQLVVESPRGWVCEPNPDHRGYRRG
ncbi:glucose-6-phosphate isomerase family protein [Kineococcus esterisolvens]|uniref:glucose-6-phosphate isomerase family protein n=1 Tax=unclassified Kineococcus TaxID=2621656 RepID=UPI003D7CBE7E